MKLRRSVKIYLWVHIAAVTALCLFPLYRLIADYLARFVSGCMIHDHFFLYCPLCGGTRAVEALLRFDLVTAWNNNAFVVLVAFAVLVLDLVALIRLLCGCQKILPIPDWSWIVAVVLMILYAVLRNYLMIAHGYDPVGDLGAFWRGF